ncbi:MAG: cytochrome c biogenesis protein CcsA, partial [Actinomycetes bacterium]
MTAADFASFSNSAVTFAGVVYALAFLAHVAEWALGRRVPVAEAEMVLAGGVGGSRQARPSPPSAELSVEKFGRVGVALTGLAGLLHLAGLVTRGLAADPVRVPWGNMYEFTLAGSMGVTLIYLLLLRRYGLRWLGLLVTGFSVVVLMLAALLLYVPAGPLVPALQSYWLVVHVVAAVIATGAFTVGGMTSLLFLVKQRAEQSPEPRTTGYIARLPASSVMDRVAYRVHAFGFPIWTFAALV